MKFLRVVPYLAITAVLMTAFMNCQRVLFQLDAKSMNTVAGNPLVSQKISQSICNVLQRCHPEISEVSCLEKVNAVPGFAAPLKLSASYGTLASITAAEASGVLRANASAMNSCQSKIESLECSSPVVQAAYDASKNDSYAGSVQMVSSESCGNVIEPTAKYACEAKIFIRGANNSSVSPGQVPQDAVFSVSPNLPAGLILDASTGVISGSPQAASAMTDYSLTMSWAGTSVTNPLKIKIADGYLVDDLSDDTNTGGANCQTASGKCSLRAAIQAANTSSGKVIVAPAGTIAINSVLNINKSMEVHGDCTGATVIDGQNKTGVFSITAGPTTLDRLIIQNGYVTNAAGAGIAIYADTTSVSATLNNLTVRANRIDNAANGTSDGAGIQVYAERASAPASITMNNSIIADNISINGWYGAGLGLWFNTHADITNCTFSGNQNLQAYGGGLSTRSGSLNISQSLFVNNSSPQGEGGGLYVNQDAPIAANISNVTFANNTSLAGGATYIGGAGATIKNATFFSNRASDSASAGAIHPQANVTIQNSIFSGNMAGSARKSCTANNYLQSGGRNLSDSAANDCALGSQDIVNSAALLGPLQGNGGATQTMALFPNSVAIGQADPTNCPAIDQRGLLRLSDGRCDIGAYEVQ